jgi:hypothetical protein
MFHDSSATAPRSATPTGETLQQQRHECKFTLPLEQVEAAKALLDHACAPDPKYTENRINSLYYDTTHLDLLSQKTESEYYKYKVRLRWYCDVAEKVFSNSAYLEIKNKFGARSLKHRFPVSLEVAQLHRDPIHAVAGHSLLEWAEPHVYDQLSGLQPACVIAYRRKRYIDMLSGLRIALDYEIQGLHPGPGLHPRGLTGRSPLAVLEVKGIHARELPSSLYSLTSLGVKKSSFSKYEICLNRLLEGV